MLGDGVAGEVSVSMLLAGVPGAPSTAPTRGASSGSTVIDVDYVAVTVTSGSAIESYQVDIDDGLGGSFVALQGDTVASLALSAQKTTGVTQGRYYRVRYRARNLIGSGEYSPIAYILAADAPVVATAGTHLSADIVVSDVVVIFALPGNGGSEILEGEI